MKSFKSWKNPQYYGTSIKDIDTLRGTITVVAEADKENLTKEIKMP